MVNGGQGLGLRNGQGERLPRFARSHHQFLTINTHVKEQINKKLACRRSGGGSEREVRSYFLTKRKRRQQATMLRVILNNLRNDRKNLNNSSIHECIRNQQKS